MAFLFERTFLMIKPTASSKIPSGITRKAFSNVQPYWTIKALRSKHSTKSAGTKDEKTRE
jgi:hypothetical protein